MYLGHCHQILYKSILQNVVKLLVTRAHGAYVMNDEPCADKQIDEMLSKEERILIEVLVVEKDMVLR